MCLPLPNIVTSDKSPNLSFLVMSKGSVDPSPGTAVIVGAHVPAKWLQAGLSAIWKHGLSILCIPSPAIGTQGYLDEEYNILAK